MSFSKTRFLATTGLLVWTGQAAPAMNMTTHIGTLNATNFYKGSSEVLSIPLRRVEHQGVGTPSLARRYFGTEVLGVYGAAYFAELTMGTGDNPQKVSVLLDTGSFELWVNPDCTTTNVKDYCDAFGHYDPAQSPSAKDLNKNFEIKYGQGSASGNYYTDDVYISGAKVQDQQFGVSNASSDVWFGILGLGYGQGNGVMEYSSVVDSLAAQGYTNSKLFSLDLGDQPGATAAMTGEMVFGGVDINKYSGNLAKVPTDPSDPHYVVTLNSITLQTPDSTPDTPNAVSLIASRPITDPSLPLPVVVDSGTTLSLLPESMVTALAAGFPGAKSDGNGGYTVPCSLRDDAAGGSVDFEFAGEGGAPVMISVAYSDFIWYGGDDQCFLGAWYTGDIGAWILGDTFLRGAYVTFDQTNNALYMANYIRCGEESNLVPVPAGPDAAASIPGSCKSPSIARPASPTSDAGLDPDCTETPLQSPPPPFPATNTTVAVEKQASATYEEYHDGYEFTWEKHFEMSTATETFTSTMVRHAVWTMDGQKVTTSHETIIKTFCPGDIIPPAPSPAPAPPQPQPQTHVRPTITKPVVVATVTTEELQVFTTESCSTRIYAITSCDASSEACVVGATTTEVVTIFETPRVHAYPSPSVPSSPVAFYSPPSPSPYPSTSTSPSSPSISYSTYYSPEPYTPHSPPAPASQQSIGTGISAGVNYGGMSWGFNNSSSTNLAGVAVAGGGASRAIGAVATPTTTRGKMMPTAIHSGFIISTSGAGTIARSLGWWSIVALIAWVMII